jgi:hypothetical protein
MPQQLPRSITVEENHYRFVWGLITVLCLLVGSLLFNPLQNSGSTFEQYGLVTVISMLFTSGIWGIYRTLQPIYSAELKVVDTHHLNIKIYYGEDPIKQYTLDIRAIQSVTFRHRVPPGPGEALYDFSTDYLIVYQTGPDLPVQPLIDISPEYMTLKLQDIKEIIYYLKHYNPSIDVPTRDKKILGL